MNRSRPPLIAPVTAGAAAVLALLVLVALRTAPEVEPRQPSSIVLDAPSEVPAGGALSVAIEVGPGPTPDLLITSGTAAVVVPVPEDRTRTVVEVPAGLTAVAGLLTVQPVGQPEAGVDVQVVPGAPVDPATPLLGQRSVVVGEQDAMVTVVPTDHLGNPVAEGLSVTVRARRPGGSEETFVSATDGLLAWTWLPAGTVAGRTVVGVEAGPARGPTADLVEVPAAPVGVVVGVEGGVPPADGRSSVVLRTGELRDRFGNLLPDGVHADVLVDGPTGPRAVAATVVSGRVTSVVVVPDRPGLLTAVVRVDGVTSPPIEVMVGPAVEEVAARAEAVEGRVGPVLDPRGGYVADGTDVVVEGTTTQLVDGRAEVELTDEGRSAVTVEVLGLVTDVTVARP